MVIRKMSSGALFGGSIARGSNKNLVEVKAGKMIMKGKTVYPDNRKGQLYVYQSDDSLMHFCWKDRLTGVVEDDLIIFPDDCEFKHVPQCETGRVYLLKFKSSCRKFFFWIQDLKPNKDEECCRKINEILNNPPSVGSQRVPGNGTEGDLQNLLNNMSQQQLMQLFGGVGQIGGLGSLLGSMNRPPSSSRTSVTSSAPVEISSVSAPSGRPPTISNNELQMDTNKTILPEGISKTTVLGRVNHNPSICTNHAGHGLESSTSSRTDRTIQESILKELNTLVMSEISSHEVSQNTLDMHLPPGDSFSTAISSPQFSQALASFWAALLSGQAAPVVQQFGLGPKEVNAANNGDVQGFIDGLERVTDSTVIEDRQSDLNEEEGIQDGDRAHLSDDNAKEDDGEQRMTLD